MDEFRGAQVAELLPREQVKTPAVGTVLIERSARAQLNLGVGERFELQLPGGRPKSVGIAGFVHEPALAPAKTEQAIYAYMSAETARVLGMSTPFDELRILVRHHPGDRDAIEQTATNIARWVTAQGLAQVHSIRVPPPLRHPHETQMTAILSLFVVFSTVILLLSCMLGATLINAWMTRQVREMGVMKALGARTPRLVLAYTLTTLTLSVLALIVAWLPGKLGGLAMAKSVTNVLNFDLASAKVPARIMAVQLGVALGLPILLAMPHIVRACRVSVKTALADHGQAQASASNAWLERWMSKFDSVLPKRLSYTLRGTLRRRRQFALSWGLFVVAGGGFVCAMTVAEAWDVLLKEVDRTRHYAVEVRLNTAPDTAEPDTAQLAARLKTLPGVAQVEVWQTAPVAESRPGQPAIERTYPDESHGTFHLVAGPSGTRLLTVPVHDGHGLTAQDDLSAVVINQFVPSFDRLRIGDTITLSIAGASRALRVVGKTVQVGVGATAYVGAGAFSQLVPRAEQQQQLWVASKVPLTAGTLDAFVADLEAELTVAGADVSSVVPVSLVKNAMAAHFEVLIYS
ncbi:MAG TPA: FtsX-like permease family protein, partial [Polyangiaceae bacterium]|nr:FtsX-like permease family protein [Polyangiaceae bacterium]